jgi:hypothetical protein
MSEPSLEAPSARARALGTVLFVLLGGVVFVFGAGPRDVGGPGLLSFHPWVLPFRDDVLMGPGAWWTWAALVGQLVATLGVAATLRPRLWFVTIAAYIALTCPVFGAFVPGGTRWLLIAAAVGLRWRGRDGVAGCALAVSALQDSLFGSLAIIAYGLSQGSIAGLVLADAVVFVVGAGLLIRAGGGWLVALPAWLVAADLVAMAASLGAMEAHHDAPATPQECQDLDVRILHPLEGPGEAFLPRGIAEGPTAIAVSGQGGVGVLTDDGSLDLHLPSASEFGRVEFVDWDGDELVAAGAGGTLRWRSDGAGWTLVRAETWSESIPELLHVSPGGGETVWTTGNYPLILRSRADDVVFLGGGHHGYVAFAYRFEALLALADAWSITAYEPGSLRPLRSRSYPPWGFAARSNAGPTRLYRMRALLGDVEVVDPHTLKTDFVFDVDHVPRYLAASGDGSLLLLGDYFGDRLELRSAADGALISTHNPGRRPRNMVWSERRGAFLGVSACGAWELAVP